MRYTAAYGSNLNREHMKILCPDAGFVSVSMLQDFRLAFRGKFLTVEKAAGFTVPVGIWKISEADEKALDVWENYPKEYYKEFISEACFIYVMHEHIPYALPDDEYLEMCLRGYEDAGFDKALIREAFEYIQEMIRMLK